VGVLTVGGVAVFVTDNGTGSAALVTIGGVLVVAAGLWDRLESFEFGGAKMQLVKRLRDRADEAEARGDTAAAAALRDEAQALLEEARPVAASYERLRESLAPGPERTAKLEGLVAEARASARQRAWDPAEVKRLFESGADGDRIFALGLMQEDERVRDFDASLTAIEHSRSAFEQYYGLALAELMLPDLTKDQRRELETLLTSGRGNARRISPGTDRSNVAQRILTRLSSA